MGSPNMDFSVRQARECLEGDMVLIRFAFEFISLQGFNYCFKARIMRRTDRRTYRHSSRPKLLHRG